MTAFFSLVITLLLPGFGHILLGFCQRGVLIFGLFIFCLNGAFLAEVAWIDSASQAYLFWPSISLAFLLWAYALRDMYYLALLRPRYKAYVAERLKRAVIAYLQSDYPKTLRHLRKILKRDKYNGDAYFYLGAVYRQQNQPKMACKAFQKCILLDYEDKWTCGIQNFYQEEGRE